MVKCYVCRYVEVEKKLGEWRSACDRCAELLKSPPCKACGQPVRDAKKNETNPYHEECRRCSSCNQKVSKLGMHCTAGKILCGSCDDLFGEFFVPGKRMGAEYMKEAFKAWDEDNSGWIDTGELRRVLKAIMPNFSDRDINDLLRVIDTNSNGVVEYEEFCQWLLKENPLDFSETTFAAYVAQLMREAGTAKDKADLCVDEIQVRQDGVYFRLKSGQMRFETTAFRTEALSLTALDPEEFISKVECVEGGLKLSFNTGRITTLEGQGELFGPFEAPMGFYIDGLRVKPLDDPVDGVKDCVTGIDVAPLPSAAEYDCSNALLYTAEQEYLRSLREILAKAAVDVNTFGAGGVTALMLASSRGCTGAMRLLLSCKANPNLADSDGWTALTYASRCGSPEAVQALLQKGATEALEATEDKTDGGRALKEALRVKHNAAARALLRAGFGPAPAGTFALEGAVKPEDCKLDAPKILPAGGAFSHPKKVSILVGNVDASKQNGAKVLFTLDGRDPFLCGERYMGPFTVTSRMQLRAVAISGTKRSQSVEATFLVCHCALPDEVIFGTLQAQIFPACLELLLKDTAETLTVTPDQFQVKTAETDFTARWIQLDLHDDPHYLHAASPESSLSGRRLGAFHAFRDGVPFIHGEEAGLAALITVLAFVVSLWLPRLSTRVPSALIAILVGTAFEWAVVRAALHSATPIVGDIADKSVYPNLFWFNDIYKDAPPLSVDLMLKVLPLSVTMAAVGLLESLMTLNLIDEITKTKGNPKRECLGQGLANIICGAFGGMGGCAMIGQSMINIGSGARTRVSSFIAGLFLLIIVLVAYPGIKQIPVSALVGVMFNVCYHTFEWSSLKLIALAACPLRVRQQFLSTKTSMQQIRRMDALVILTVTLVTLFTDLATAVAVGMVISLFYFALETSSAVQVVPREPSEGVQIYDVHGTLFFGSTSHFLELFPEAVVKKDPEDVRLVFETGHVADFSAVQALNKLGERYGVYGKRLTLEKLMPKTHRVLSRAQGLLVEEITLSLDEQMVLPNLEPELPSHLHIERVPSVDFSYVERSLRSHSRDESDSA